MEKISIDSSILNLTVLSAETWLQNYIEEYRSDVDSAYFFARDKPKLTIGDKAFQAWRELENSHHPIQIKHGRWNLYKEGKLVLESEYYLGFKLYSREFHLNKK